MSSWSEASFHDCNVERMIVWLREENLHDCVRPFSLKKINGISFLNLSDHDIKAFQISQESKRKLAKVLKRIKGKMRNAHRSFEEELKRRSAIPAHVNHHDEGEIEDWGSDFDSEDDDDREEEGSDSDSAGEYIEPESDDTFCPPESPTKEVPNIPVGLVAQLRAGLSGSIRRNPLSGPPASLSHPQAEDDNDIYDLPPDEEEEFYEQPSDDSGSAIVVRPNKTNVIRCPSETGEYIDAIRPPTNSDEDVVPYPLPPRRPPKPGAKVIKPPAMRQPAPPIDQEIYEEVPEDQQPGCSQVVEEYEAFPSGSTEQETYEIPDNGSQDTYEVPEPEPEPETYEIPEQELAQPALPPPRGSCWNPPKKTPVHDKRKPLSPKEPVKQKQVKLAPAGAKPQISPKPGPSPPKPAQTVNTTSRLYPNQSNAGPIKPPQTIRLSSTALSSPSPRPVISSPPPHSTPAKREENNNEKITNNSPSPRVPPLRRPPATFPVDPSPPPPPRPGPKPDALKPPGKPPRISESDILVEPKSPSRKTPLPPLPTLPKSPFDQLRNFPWFHGPLDKKIAENALKSYSKEGAFIVRNSSKDPNSYSMSLFFKGSARHLRMPRTNNKFVLGDSGKVQFSTVMELVDYYSQHQVDLKSGGSTSLTAACPVKS